jgi:hypothetical protein
MNGAPRPGSRIRLDLERFISHGRDPISQFLSDQKPKLPYPNVDELSSVAGSDRELLFFGIGRKQS